jgi:hypothetical protein
VNSPLRRAIALPTAGGDVVSVEAPEAQALAKKHRVRLWDFRDLLREIAAASKDQRTYFTDDTARTIQLFAMAADDRKSTTIKLAAPPL